MTPLSLAILSIVVGIFPLLVASLAKAIARSLGGSLSEADCESCMLFGRDISPILYRMFVFAWLSMFTLGLGMLGVMGAIAWALLS
ncbi:hypothetical protein EUZ85_12860 [Hahella sp. KA22]|uniref:hypothetical protein n=1 Tax=Hahella sp. KA22 TaxID=1628392 RepID=UPI000FDD387A|nr:hypothetical protein [Hahella sp. KA22]AZZ91566.1 hypothetical protein ENC22_10300 [Hahella sp. KA22]QAY54936.1 hypothetical protein EUZ85_12860 [Hahella sp. KA22]